MMTCTCASPRHGWPLLPMEGTMTWTGAGTMGEQSCCSGLVVIPCGTAGLDLEGASLEYSMLCGQAAHLGSGAGAPALLHVHTAQQPAPRGAMFFWAATILELLG